MKKITLLFTILISVIAIQISFAAPSLTITKPPVAPVPSWTGPGVPQMPPPGDPDAIYGQWFVDRDTGTMFTNRTHEFYDNVDGWGGGYQGNTAIFGYVSFINWSGPGSPITAFDIDATIINDVPANSGWASGYNSHNEQRPNSMEGELISGTLLDVKLTAEFSIDSSLPYFPPTWAPPYFDMYSGVYIEAFNHDELAWYCWTDDPQSPDPGNPGNFYVPTWDFGNIPQGGSTNVIMQFRIPVGLPPADPRYTVITNSYFNTSDVLLNRTSSLKISEWIEDLVADTGVPYPDNPHRSSDVSVFHNVPEPGIFAGITIILLGLFRKFRK